MIISRLKRGVGLCATLTLLFAVAGSLVSIKAQSVSYDVSSLIGGYGFEFSGWTPTNAGQTNINSYSPFAVSGLWTFHGDGTFSGDDTACVRGDCVARHYTGTYTVAADGRGTATFLTPNTGVTHTRSLVIDSQNTEVAFIQLEQGNIGAGRMKKQ